MNSLNKPFLNEQKTHWTIYCWTFKIWAVQKYVSVVDLVKIFPLSIYLKNRRRYSRERASQSLAVIQFIHSFMFMSNLLKILGLRLLRRRLRLEATGKKRRKYTTHAQTRCARTVCHSAGVVCLREPRLLRPQHTPASFRTFVGTLRKYPGQNMRLLPNFELYKKHSENRFF